MSLSTLGKIREALERRPSELEQARLEGKKVVGWLNYNVPEELIHAFNLIPVHLGSGGSERLVELGSRYISVMNCVFTRQTVGLFAERKDPFIQNVDLVVVDVTCKQLYRVAEIIQHYFEVRTEIIGVPYNSDVPAGKEYFRNEIKAFVAKLAEFTGRDIDDQKLRASIILYNDIRDAIRKLYYWQAKPVAPISWRDVYEVVHAGYFLDKENYLRLLQELLQELDNAAPAEEVSPTAPRILLTGSIIPPGDRKIFGILENIGTRVVADDLWSGFGPHFDLKIDELNVAGIADSYLSRHPHASLPNLDLQSDRRLKNLLHLIKEFGVDGVLFHSLRYCDSFTFKANETKNVLQKASIPFLEIHTEYAGSDFEAIRTRAEAFAEVLKTKTLEAV